MNRPALHDPFLAWEGELDGTRYRIVFTEFYADPEEADFPPATEPTWMIYVEYNDGHDALGKPIWMFTTYADDLIRCLALALVDAIGKRPLWAKDPK